MRLHMIIQKILVICLGFIFIQTLHGQMVEYKHPLFDIGFKASPSWEEELHDYNGKVFQLTHPNNNMHINLSFVPDCKNPQRYLRRMSGIKGLVSQKKPYDTLLNDKHAVIMKGMCLQGKKPFRRLVVGIPDNAGLFLMEICCPEDCYLNHQSQMRSIIGSLRVGV